MELGADSFRDGACSSCRPRRWAAVGSRVHYRSKLIDASGQPASLLLRAGGRDMLANGHWAKLTKTSEHDATYAGAAASADAREEQKVAGGEVQGSPGQPRHSHTAASRGLVLCELRAVRRRASKQNEHTGGQAAEQQHSRQGRDGRAPSTPGIARRPAPQASSPARQRARHRRLSCICHACQPATRGRRTASSRSRLSTAHSQHAGPPVGAHPQARSGRGSIRVMTSAYLSFLAVLWAVGSIAGNLGGAA